LLSVVTIAYNDLVGLQETLKSVEEQDLPLEHIVVDGGSEDGSADLLGSLKHSGFRFVSEPDRGRYHAMNKGASLANGDVLWFMHAGDTFASCSSARTGYELLLQSKRSWGYGLSRVRRYGDVIEIRGAVPFDLTMFLVGKQTIPHQAVVIKRDFFRLMGGHDEHFGLAEDQRFLMACVLEERPTVISEILCDFDGDGAGSTRRARDHYGDFWRARRKHRVKIMNSLFADILSTAYYFTRTATGQAIQSWRVQR
jgi:hypothetical protein